MLCSLLCPVQFSYFQFFQRLDFARRVRKLQRRDARPSLVERVLVRSVGHVSLLARHPPQLRVQNLERTAVELGVHVVLRDGTCNLDLRGARRNHDVEVVDGVEDVRARGVLHQTPREPDCVGVVGAVGRDSDSGNAQVRRLYDGTHGPRAVERAHADVRTGVRPRDDEVGLPVERAQTHDDALARRPLDGVADFVFRVGDFVRELLPVDVNLRASTDGVPAPEGERASYAAAVLRGCDDGDVRARPGERVV